MSVKTQQGNAFPSDPVCLSSHYINVFLPPENNVIGLNNNNARHKGNKDAAILKGKNVTLEQSKNAIIFG